MPVYVPGSLGPSARTNLGPTKVATAAPYAVVGAVPSNNSAAYSAAVLADSPAAYYKLNETSGTTAADSSGNGHAGGYNPTYTLGVSGEPTGDLAVTLDGSTGNVQSGSAIGITADQAQTFEAWCTRASSGALVGLVSFGTGAGYFRWGGTVGNQLEFVSNGVAVAATSSVAHTDTNWHHVVVTYAGSGGLVSFYFDGAVEGTPANTAHAMAASGLYSAVGVCSGYSVQYFNGTIGEAAIYPTALTAASVLAHYNAAIGTGGPVAYFANLVATSLTVPNIQKAAAKTLAVVALTVPALRKAISKTLVVDAAFFWAFGSVVSTTIASVQKAAGKGLSANSTSAVSMTKAISKILSATSTTASSVRKAVAKILAATSTTVPTLATFKALAAVAYYATLAATSTTIASIKKAAGKGLSATTTTVPSIRKAISKTLAATSTSVPALQKAISKGLSATSTSAPALQKAIAKTLSAVSLSVPTLVPVKDVIVIIHLALGKLISASGAGILRSRSGIGNLITRAGTGAIKTRSGLGWLISRSGLGNLRSK